MSNPMYQLPMKLYFEDTDAMGIVYHANYFKFFERARTEWLRTGGFHHMELAKLGVGFVIRKCEAEWFAPLTLDDEIIATGQVIKMGSASIDLEQTAIRNGEVVCRARILMVCVDFKSKRPQAIPDNLRAIFVADNN